MHQGNWTCSKCGGSITQLPFEPRSNTGLTCRDCYFKEKDGGGGSAATPGGGVQANEADSVGGSAELDSREDIPDFDPSEFGGAAEPVPEPPEFAEAPAAKKEEHTGDWKCATCGNAITSLPFTPRSTENLKCIDCFKKSKA